MLVDQILSTDSQKAGDCISPECWEALEKAGAVIIWGTGAAGKYAYQQCLAHGIPVTCFACNTGNSASLFGCDVYVGEAFFKQFPPDGRMTIFICSAQYSQIIAQLAAKGYERLFYWDTHLLRFFQNSSFQSYQSFSQKLIADQKDKIEKVYSLLEDETSRKTFSNLLKYRVYLNRSLLAEIQSGNAYFGNDIFPAIKGAERNALVGARQTILSNPYIRMAICVYHLADDLWEIPLKIHELHPTGRLAMRHHSDSINETVCYVFQ